LTFSGGEIFCALDLLRNFGRRRRLHFDISLKTNALLVTPERAVAVARVWRTGACRSAFTAISPQCMTPSPRFPDRLQRTLAAIPILLEHGLQVKLACPLMQENLMAYRGVMALAEKLGIPYILDLTITPMMDGSGGPLAHRASVSSLLPVLQDPLLHACKPQPGAQTASAVNDSPPAFESAVSSGIESLAYERFALQRGP